MTAPETPDELRARLNELTGPYAYDERHFSDALVNAWPTIDALLARLTAAEAERDEALIAINGGCGCPAPFDTCPHDEPLLPALNDARARLTAAEDELLTERQRGDLNAARADTEQERNDALLARLTAAEAVLEQYADPDSYFALVIFGDPPCGWFGADFGPEDEFPEYERPMPGKAARDYLRERPS